jgi:hypothetical protein
MRAITTALSSFELFGALGLLFAGTLIGNYLRRRIISFARETDAQDGHGGGTCRDCLKASTAKGDCMCHIEHFRIETARSAWPRTVLCRTEDSIILYRQARPETSRVGHMELTPQYVCWICGKPVSPESKPDEYGFFAHTSCLRASTKKPRPPQTA